MSWHWMRVSPGTDWDDRVLKTFSYSCELKRLRPARMLWRFGEWPGRSPIRETVRFRRRKQRVIRWKLTVSTPSCWPSSKVWKRPVSGRFLVSPWTKTSSKPEARRRSTPPPKIFSTLRDRWSRKSPPRSSLRMQERDRSLLRRLQPWGANRRIRRGRDQSEWWSPITVTSSLGALPQRCWRQSHKIAERNWSSLWSDVWSWIDLVNRSNP